MKIEYTCEVCGKKFNSEAEAAACEKAHVTVKKDSLKEASQRAIDKLYNQHIKNFGELPKPNIDPENEEVAFKAALQGLFDTMKNLAGDEE